MHMIRKRLGVELKCTLQGRAEYLQLPAGVVLRPKKWALEAINQLLQKISGVLERNAKNGTAETPVDNMDLLCHVLNRYCSHYK